MHLSPEGEISPEGCINPGEVKSRCINLARGAITMTQTIKPATESS
jgi:hypothetical protein